MRNRNDLDYLIVIMNLLALQLTRDKSLGDGAILLRRAGMKYSNISQVLGISEDSARALTSIKRRLREKASKNQGRTSKGKIINE
jgi:hypothetical protein